MDRNGLGVCHYRDDVSSLSARRAWIEMLAPRLVDMSAAVALRKESVDRNREIFGISHSAVMSLSARRAWIEIRNGGILKLWVCCRSPQGERG